MVDRHAIQCPPPLPKLKLQRTTQNVACHPESLVDRGEGAHSRAWRVCLYLPSVADHQLEVIVIIDGAAHVLVVFTKLLKCHLSLCLERVPLSHELC